jgi:hypothetical protein
MDLQVRRLFPGAQSDSSEKPHSTSEKNQFAEIEVERFPFLNANT